MPHLPFASIIDAPSPRPQSQSGMRHGRQKQGPLPRATAAQYNELPAIIKKYETETNTRRTTAKPPRLSQDVPPECGMHAKRHAWRVRVGCQLAWKVGLLVGYVWGLACSSRGPGPVP
eukprot:scaffold836_cov123-Isochrysis_galbana.AAC.7